MPKKRGVRTTDSAMVATSVGARPDGLIAKADAVATFINRVGLATALIMVAVTVILAVLFGYADNPFKDKEAIEVQRGILKTMKRIDCDLRQPKEEVKRCLERRENEPSP